MKPKFSTSFKRIIAAIVDIAITVAYFFLIVEMPFMGNLSESALEVILSFSVSALGLQFYFRDTIYYGRSLGKRLFGLIVINTDEQFYYSDIPFGRRVLRQLIVCCASLIEVIVLLVTGSTLGDKMSHTTVIAKRDFDEFLIYREELRNAEKYRAEHPDAPAEAEAPQTETNGIPDYFKNTPVDSEAQTEEPTTEPDDRVLSAPYAPNNKWAQNNPYAPPPPPRREVNEDLLSDNYAPSYDPRNKVEYYDDDKTDIKDPHRDPSYNPYKPPKTAAEKQPSAPVSERELSPNALARKADEKGKLMKIMLILVGFSICVFVFVVGVVFISLSMVKNSDGYHEAYSYLISSQEFRDLGADAEDVSLKGYSSKTNLAESDPEKKHTSVYRFSVNGELLVVICHMQNGAIYVCEDCTLFE